MTPIGIGVLWLGYSVLVYGWSQLRGANVGLFTLMWPGKYEGKPNLDSGTPTRMSSNGGNAPPIKVAGVKISSVAQARSYLGSAQATSAEKEAAIEYMALWARTHPLNGVTTPP